MKSLFMPLLERWASVRGSETRTLIGACIIKLKVFGARVRMLENTLVAWHGFGVLGSSVMSDGDGRPQPGDHH